MRAGLVKMVAFTLCVSVLSSGCILSRAIDRQFIGATVRKPASQDRMVTGLVLLPFTAAIDLVTFPIQAIVVAIAGDNFPFGPSQDIRYSMVSMLDGNPKFDALSPEQKVAAREELEGMIRDGKFDANHLAALGEDGHWVLIEISQEVREQALARANFKPTSLASR